MLLNKFLKSIIVAGLSVFLISCGDKDEPDTPKLNLNDSNIVTNAARSLLGEGLKFAYAGFFDQDTLTEVAAGTEIENKDEWGIKFYLLKQDDQELVSEFETKLLEGSFNECLVKKIKFPSFNYELVYYNSQDYFLGSGGGEIFSYIVDFNNEQTYYAHLFAEQGKPVSLFLSENINNTEVKNFFVSNFKRDYPALTVVENDVDLKY